MMNGHWNAVCIACHTTAPKTQFDTPFRSQPIDEQSVETTAAEFGISCEACHGPGQIHVDANQNPLRRYQLYLSDQPDPTIVQPALLDPRRLVASLRTVPQCVGVLWTARASGRQTPQGSRIGPETSSETRVSCLSRWRTWARRVLQDFIGRDPEFMTGSFWPGRDDQGLWARVQRVDRLAVLQRRDRG